MALIFSIAIFGYLKRKGCWQRQKLTNGGFYLCSLLENKRAKCLILDFFVFTRCYGGGAFVLDENWVALADSEASALTRIAVFKAVAKTSCQCWFSLIELALEWRWTLSSFALLNPPQNLLCVLLNSPTRFKNTTSLMSAFQHALICGVWTSTLVPLAVAEASLGLSRDLIFDLHWQTIILHSQMSAELFWRSVVIG